MDEKEILSRVDALAEKLGTTAEYLWGVAVQETVTRGIVQAALALVLGLLALRCFRKSSAAYAAASKESFADNVSPMMAMLFSAAAILSMLAWFAVSVSTVAAPRLHALETLLGGGR